ncbi:hypothetical protein [Streptomyces sp. NPDC051567]|uniref:hypothetical protein n=1 Tax=Streptomyces sp. NPDC051567 TaxID=3365660 RepID=UPI0037A01447
MSDDYQLAVMVEPTPGAAPAQPLAQALDIRRIPVGRTTAEGAALAVAAQAPVLRVQPHPDHDACGHDRTHAAYRLTWAVPVLCERGHPRTPAALPGLWQECHTCALTVLDRSPRPPGPHLTWWDISDATHLRAAPLPPAGHIQPAQDQSQDQSQDGTADRYDWHGLAGRLTAHGAARPRRSTLTPEQQVALAGAHRLLLLDELARAEQTLRDRMYHARNSGPVRLSALTGISRRTVPGWITATATAATAPSRTTA